MFRAQGVWRAFGLFQDPPVRIEIRDQDVLVMSKTTKNAIIGALRFGTIRIRTRLFFAREPQQDTLGMVQTTSRSGRVRA